MDESTKYFKIRNIKVAKNLEKNRVLESLLNEKEQLNKEPEKEYARKLFPEIQENLLD